jgi:hypothetical protein
MTVVHYEKALQPNLPVLLDGRLTARPMRVGYKPSLVPPVTQASASKK